MSGDVVDFSAARGREVAKRLAEQVKIQPPLPEVVAIVGCAGCGSVTFNLAHDLRVMCACCHTTIVGMSWSPDAPKGAA